MVNELDVGEVEDCRRPKVAASEVVIENGIGSVVLSDYHRGTAGYARASV